MSRERMGPVPKDQYDDEQKAAHEDFVACERSISPAPGTSSSARRNCSPQPSAWANICDIAARCRAGFELAILLVARHWTQDYEWGAHRKMALKAGVEPSTIEAIRTAAGPRAYGGGAVRL